MHHERDKGNMIVDYRNTAASHKNNIEEGLSTVSKALEKTDYEFALSVSACTKSYAAQVNAQVPAGKYNRLLKAAHKIGAEKNFEKVDRVFGDNSNLFFRLLRPVLSYSGHYERVLDLAEHHYKEAGIEVPEKVAELRNKIK